MGWRRQGDAGLKQLIKKWVVGTPLEGVARAAYRAMRGSSALDKNSAYDAQTAQVIERVLARDSNCIDVGCHHGSILDVILAHAPDGRHLAFEPLPDAFEALQRKYAGRANVQLRQSALAEAPGESTFQHVVSNPGYSGLLRRRYDREQEEVVEIRVRLERLDDVIPATMPIRFVKIDVEGAEMGVLRGAVETLRRARPYVVFEHGLGAADCYGTTPEMVHDLLSACGLRVALMKDWLASEGREALSRAAFADEFASGRNYYFMAHP